MKGSWLELERSLWAPFPFIFELWGACPSTFHEGFMAGARTVSVSSVSFHFELWGACPSTLHEDSMGRGSFKNKLPTWFAF